MHVIIFIGIYFYPFLVAELTRAVKDAEAMKSQAESVSREYDRLMDEHARLQKRLALVEGEESNKKGD
jgi:B-cell receptor-associated protein 31